LALAGNAASSRAAARKANSLITVSIEGKPRLLELLCYIISGVKRGIATAPPESFTPFADHDAFECGAL
jgi:hypothetical protein